MSRNRLSLIVGAVALAAMATPAMAFTNYGSTIDRGASSNFSDPDAKFDAMSGDQGGSDGTLMQLGGSAASASATRSKLNANQDKDVGFSGFYIPEN